MSLYIKAYELKCLIVAFLNAPIEFDLATVIGKLFHNLRLMTSCLHLFYFELQGHQLTLQLLVTFL